MTSHEGLLDRYPILCSVRDWYNNFEYGEFLNCLKDYGNKILEVEGGPGLASSILKHSCPSQEVIYSDSDALTVFLAEQRFKISKVDVPCRVLRLGELSISGLGVFDLVFSLKVFDDCPSKMSELVKDVLRVGKVFAFRVKTRSSLVNEGDFFNALEWSEYFKKYFGVVGENSNETEYYCFLENKQKEDGSGEL